MIAEAKKEGEKARTPEVAPKKKFDKSDIFGAALTFAQPSSSKGEGEKIPKEAQAILDALRAKIKEAASIRALNIGNEKIESEKHRAIEKIAKECAEAHFTTSGTLKALKALARTEKVQTSAQYPHTLLQAILKCCHQRGVKIAMEDIGLDPPTDA